MIILTALVFWLAIWNGLRLGAALFYWKTLLEYGTHPFYIAISGGAWFIIGLILAWCLWVGKVWTWMGAIVCAISYALWYWIDRLILQIPHANWPFSLVITAVLLAFVFFTLLSPKTKRMLNRDDHERQPETPTTP
jgi:hypothetical protein